MYASYFGREGVVQMLLELSRINPNTTRPRERSVLMDASMLRRDREIVKHLLAHPDIDINVQDYKGHTALHLALNNNYLDLARLIVAHPGYTYQRGGFQKRNGQTALNNGLQRICSRYPAAAVRNRCYKKRHLGYD